MAGTSAGTAARMELPAWSFSPDSVCDWLTPQAYARPVASSSGVGVHVCLLGLVPGGKWLRPGLNPLSGRRDRTSEGACCCHPPDVGWNSRCALSLETSPC